jgi:hypothetical protein
MRVTPQMGVFQQPAKEYFVDGPFRQRPTVMNSFVLSGFNQSALYECINPYAKDSPSL